MSYRIMGNSIAADVSLDGARAIVMRGRRLREMNVSREGVTTIVISGIPDIMERGATRVNGRMVTRYEEDLMEVAGKKDVILCPFYPPYDLVPEQLGIIRRLNHQICEINLRNGEGTPDLVAGVFGRGNSGSLFFNRELLRDGVHPGPELARRMSTALKEYVQRRENKKKGDLRDRLEGKKIDGRQDRREDRQERQVESRQGRRLGTADQVWERRRKREEEAKEKHRREREELKKRHGREMEQIRVDFERELERVYKDSERSRSPVARNADIRQEVPRRQDYV